LRFDHQRTLSGAFHSQKLTVVALWKLEHVAKSFAMCLLELSFIKIFAVGVGRLTEHCDCPGIGLKKLRSFGQFWPRPRNIPTISNS
jgi:hypothetical protein